MKKGGGKGPLKPWQPIQFFEKGANSYPSLYGKDK